MQVYSAQEGEISVKKRMMRALWGALAAAAFMLALPGLIQQIRTEKGMPQSAQRKLVTVWIKGDALGASAWIRSQAADYQKKQAGVNIWVRSASQADMALLSSQFAEAAPDLLVFAAGERVFSAWLQETDKLPLAGERAQSGQLEGRQLAVPLCMAGYVLVKKTQEAAVTPAPTSLFGVTPAPDVRRTAEASPVPKELWPEDVWADDRMGAALLALLKAPAGAKTVGSADVQAAFLQGKAQAALLTTVQARAAQAQGKGMEMLAAPPASDLVIFGAVMQDADDAAADFLRHLLKEEAQTALRERGMFAVRQDVRLYSADTPVLQAAEAALKDGWLPNAFTWPDQQTEMRHTGQIFYEKALPAAVLFE